MGVRGRGSVAFYAHQPEQGAQLVAAADTDDAALDLFRDTYGPDVFVTDDHAALLEQPLDAVVITSPDYLHEEHALAAMQKGIAVFLEKPMAPTIEACDRILEAAAACGGRLFVGHNLRHFGIVQTMKSLLEEGAIGEVKTLWAHHYIAYGGDLFFKDWHAERKHVTSLLVHEATDDFDTIHYLCGGMTRRVHAMGGLSVYGKVKARHDPAVTPDASRSAGHWPPLTQAGMNPNIDVEDVSMVQMQLDNGILCAYQQCHFTPDAWRNYTLVGTEGRLENLGDTAQVALVRLWNRRYDYYNPDGDADYPVPGPAKSTDERGADPCVMAEFLAYLKGEAQPCVSPLDARNAVAVACTATESLRNGGVPLDVPPPPAHIAEYFSRV